MSVRIGPLELPPLRIDRIKVTLVIAILAIYVPPFVPMLAERFATVLTVVLVALAVLAFVWKRSWIDAGIPVVLAVGFFVSMQLFTAPDDLTLVLRTASVLAFTFFTATLLLGPWAHFTPHIQKLYKYRRHLGVTTFLLAQLHASIIMKVYFHYSLAQAFASSFVFFGVTGLFILFWLAITSWDWLQKHIVNRWWSVLHTVLGVCYAGLVAYLHYVTLDITLTRKLILYAFIVFCFLVAPWGIARRMVRWLNGWKQLHVLIYIAYASVVIHVWTGVAQLQRPWVQALFWTMVIAVVTSHAIGWILQFRAYLRRRAQPALPTTIQEQRTYANIGSANRFVEGQGTRVEVNGKSLAIFKHQGKYIAMSAVCPHQNGPIADGKIVDGYVVCPWHQYQFNVKDGQGPVDFPDCIPFYDTFERNGELFVATMQAPNCHIVDGRTKKSQ